MSAIKDSLIAKKYAEALAEVKLSQEILEQLNMIKILVEESSELKSFLLNPSIQKEEKSKVIKTVFLNKVDQKIINTLLVLLERRRVSIITLLADSYKEIFNERNNTQEAKLSTAQDLGTDEINTIKANLEKIFNKGIEIKHSIDESLVAGLKVVVGNKVIDSSLKKKISKLKDLMNI